MPAGPGQGQGAMHPASRSPVFRCGACPGRLIPAAWPVSAGSRGAGPTPLSRPADGLPRSSQRSTLNPAATGLPSRETEAGSATSTARGVLVPQAGAEFGGAGGNCVDPSPSPQPPPPPNWSLSEALCDSFLEPSQRALGSWRMPSLRKGKAGRGRSHFL